MDKLPPIYVEEPGYSKRAVFGVALVSLLLLTIPIGVYLSLQRQDPRSRASVQNEIKLENSLELMTQSNQVGAYEQIPVQLLLRSETEEANLFVAKINYPTDLLELISISTDSAKIKSASKEFSLKWIENSFDRNIGKISIVAGVANGVKTAPADKQQIATLIFKSKKPGVANIRFDDISAIYSNSENNNILSSRKNLTVTVTEQTTGIVDTQTPQATPSALNYPLKLLFPVGGEAFSYNTPIKVRWDSDKLDLNNISLLLYLNGNTYGKVANLKDNLGFYDFLPQETIPLVYLADQNSFQIEIAGITKNGEIYSGSISGPFTIIDDPGFGPVNLRVGELSNEVGDLNGDGFVNFIDVAAILTNFGLTGAQINSGDLNTDRRVNDVDLWILRQILIRNLVIK